MSSHFETPILFLIFNRPDTTRLVFEQITKIKPQQLFIAADGPRTHVPGEDQLCFEARNITNMVDWNCRVYTLYREQNLGCGRAVSSAVNWFFEQVPEGIILEDDCFPDLSFFRYCSELLAKYRSDNQVKLIGGNNFQQGISRGGGSYYFTHYPEIWGWASWRRVWEEYDYTMDGLEQTFTTGNGANVFKTAKERRYWHKKFLKAQSGEINTWDYQLMYSIIKNDGLSISPQVNLVKNIGIENNPTHRSLFDSNKQLNLHSVQFPLVHPAMIVDNAADYFTFQRIYSRSVKRLLRLIKENGLKRILLYSVRSIFKRSK